MKINKISNSEFDEGSISSLPIRPNRMSKYGDGGMSASELKAAFDKNTELLKEKINSLIDALYNSDTDLSVAADISTGIEELPTLKDVFESIEDGTLAAKIKLTDEYNLLNFATKVMSFLFPERAIEFIKVKKINGAYTLPDAPYAGHEEGIYLVPSNASLTLFNSYVWSGSRWELWSSGSLEGYFASLSEYIEELSSSKADRSSIVELQRTKADLSDLYELADMFSASYSGSPFTYRGNLSRLNTDSEVEYNRIYLLCCEGEEDHGYWCYFNGYSWVKGGKYLADAQNTAVISMYQTLPVQSRSVKAFVDTCVIQALSQFTDNCIGDVNVFDDSAISKGYINASGAFVENESYITTDYINAMAALRVYCSRCYMGKDGSEWKPISYCLYDSNKNYISGSAQYSSSGLECSVPILHSVYSGIRYIRLSFSLNSYENSTRHMIEYGNSASEYSPFYDFKLSLDSKMNEKSEKPVKNSVLTKYINERTNRIQWLFGGADSYPKFDTQNNKLIFNPKKSEEECGLLLNGDYYRFEKGKSLEIDISPAVTLDKNGLECDIGKICIDVENLKTVTKDACANLGFAFSVHGANAALPSREYVPIGTFRRSSEGFSAFMECPFYIDNKLLGVTYSAEEIESKLPSKPEDSEEIISRAAAIKAELDEVTEDDSIRFAVAFLSDNANTKKALALCRKISESYNIPFLSLCGMGNDPEGLNELAKAESSVPLLVTMGDGDYGAQNGCIGTLSTGKGILPSSDYISPKEYKRWTSSLKGDYPVRYDYENPNHSYFYTDFEDACIRVVFLNTADIPTMTKTLSAGTAYTDRDGNSQTLENDLETMKYESQTTRSILGPQFNFLMSECLDFRSKNNPKEWAVITVQCAPPSDWTSEGFSEKYMTDNGIYLERVIKGYNTSKSCGMYNSGDFYCNKSTSFIARGGQVIACLYSGYEKDAETVQENIQRIACKGSALVSEDSGNEAIICEIISISRKKGRLDILRAGAGESRSYSFTPSTLVTRKDTEVIYKYTASSSANLKTGSTYISDSYYINSDGNPSLSIYVPKDIDYDFKARVVLGQTPDLLALDYPEGIKFTGDDISVSYFYPQRHRRYTIDFWYDGYINAHVRSIESHETMEV